MASYTHEYSDFPNTLYAVRNFLDLKDAPVNVAEVVTQIKNYIVEKNFSAAATVLSNYKDTLAQYMVDAEYINKLDEELRNLEIYTRTKKQALYYQNDKPDGVAGDIWISD